MRLGIADPASPTYFNLEAFLNQLKQVSINSGTERALAVVPVGSNGLPSGGFNLPLYDYVSLAQATLTDTYTFKTGGSGGITVATITITFTDSAKGTISTVAKT